MPNSLPGYQRLSPDTLEKLHAEWGIQPLPETVGLVRVSSRRGEWTGKALFTDRMRAEEIFIPFVKLSQSAANFLTNAAYDLESRIPEYKVCAVRVEALDSPSSGPAPSGRKSGEVKVPTE